MEPGEGTVKKVNGGLVAGVSPDAPDGSRIDPRRSRLGAQRCENERAERFLGHLESSCGSIALAHKSRMKVPAAGRKK